MYKVYIGGGNSPLRQVNGDLKMTNFENLNELSSEVIDQIEAALTAEGFDVSTSVSSQSCSAYAVIRIEDDDDEIEEIKIRVSNHDVVNPASQSDFYIGINQPNQNVNMIAYEVFEREIVEYDEDGEVVDSEWVDCGEDDDDAAFKCWSVHQSYIDDAVSEVVKFVKEKVKL